MMAVSMMRSRLSWEVAADCRCLPLALASPFVAFTRAPMRLGWSVIVHRVAPRLSICERRSIENTLVCRTLLLKRNVAWQSVIDNTTGRSYSARTDRSVTDPSGPTLRAGSPGVGAGMGRAHQGSAWAHHRAEARD